MNKHIFFFFKKKKRPDLRSLFFFFFIFLYLSKIIYELSIVFLKGEKGGFYRNFNDNNNSIFQKKLKNGETYLIIDSFFDIILVLKKIFFLGNFLDFLKFFIVYLFFFFIFLWLSFLFIFFLCFFLFYYFLIILISLLLGQKKILLLETYYSETFDINLIKNICLLPKYWAKVIIYSILGFRKKKINYLELEQILISRILGAPTWVLKSAYIWADSFFLFFKKEVFMRKKKKIWIKIILRNFMNMSRSILVKKFQWDYFKTQKLRIIVENRKITLNVHNLSLLLKLQENILPVALEVIPLQIKLEKVLHQAIGIDDIVYVFTTEKRIMVESFDTQELIKVETTQLSQNLGTQYFSRSYINLEECVWERGFRQSFIAGNNLFDLKNLNSFCLRMALIHNYGKTDYLWYQDGGNHGYASFTKSYYNRTLNDSFPKSVVEGRLGSATKKQFSPLLGSLVKENSTRVDDWEENMIIRKFSNAEIIDGAMAELHSIDGMDLYSLAQKQGYSELIELLDMKNKESLREF